MENLAFNEQDFFEEVAASALAEGVADQAAFDAYVEEAVNHAAQQGELHDDEDLEGIETQIKARWEEYAAMLAKEVA